MFAFCETNSSLSLALEWTRIWMLHLKRLCLCQALQTTSMPPERIVGFIWVVRQVRSRCEARKGPDWNREHRQPLQIFQNEPSHLRVTKPSNAFPCVPIARQPALPPRSHRGDGSFVHSFATHSVWSVKLNARIPSPSSCTRRCVTVPCAMIQTRILWAWPGFQRRQHSKVQQSGTRCVVFVCICRCSTCGLRGIKVPTTAFARLRPKRSGWLCWVIADVWMMCRKLEWILKPESNLVHKARNVWQQCGLTHGSALLVQALHAGDGARFAAGWHAGFRWESEKSFLQNGKSGKNIEYGKRQPRRNTPNGKSLLVFPLFFH